MVNLVRGTPAQGDPGSFDTDLQTHRLHVGVYPVDDAASVQGYGWKTLYKDKATCMAAVKEDKELQAAILGLIMRATQVWGKTAYFWVCEAEIPGRPA